MWRSWQRACFGSRMSQVRILSSRPSSSPPLVLREWMMTADRHAPVAQLVDATGPNPALLEDPGSNPGRGTTSHPHADHGLTVCLVCAFRTFNPRVWVRIPVGLPWSSSMTAHATGCGAVGSAPRSGRGGRGSESRHPDHNPAGCPHQRDSAGLIPPWCNGSTRVFGTFGPGSNPSGGACRIQFRPGALQESDRIFCHHMNA